MDCWQALRGDRIYRRQVIGMQPIKVYPGIKKLPPSHWPVAQQFGDSEAAAQSLAVLRNDNTPVDEQNQAIKGLAEKQWPELLPVLPELWERPGVRIAAIRALAAYDHWDSGEELLEYYPKFNSGREAGSGANDGLKK